MSEFTPRNALPYPAETDTPDVPKDMKALAEALDKLINPPGTLRMTAASAVESGWLACEGQEVSQTTYAALFAAIGSSFGTAAAGNFKLPDYRERVPVGSGTGTGGAGGLARGAMGGEWKHTLTIPEMPAHGHNWKLNEAGMTNELWAANTGILVFNAQNNFFGDVGFTAAPGVFQYHVTVEATGSSQSHNNVQPYTVCNVWIKT